MSGKSSGWSAVASSGAVRKALALLFCVAVALAAALALAAIPPNAAYADPSDDGADSAAIEEQVYVPDEGSLAESDELLSGYLYNRFHEGTSAELEGNQGLTALSGIDLEIYQSLKTQIAAVAAGEESSTVFKVSPSTQANSVDLGSILDALLADCPYELYWYDKTSGTSMSASLSHSGYYSSITLSFRVSSVYQGSGTYTVDTSKTSAAANAVTKAASIVSAASGKSDYEKLVYYRQSICDLVSYNSTAAGGSVAYGDPWQIIYVFDGDTSTNVVCEGYAKAFQYLCDLSTFANDITCYSVTGTMAGGAHEWNVVSINGSSYLVDVTNCDDGTVGEPDELFLIGYYSGYSGSWDTKYKVATDHCEVFYAYDDDTKNLFGQSILTLASSNLDPSTLSDASTTTSLSECTISSIAAQTYTGSAITPSLTVKYGSTTLKQGTDYTVAYSNNINAGTAKVTVTGEGDYTGTATATFTISRAKISVPIAKSGLVYTGGEQTGVASGTGYTLSGTAKATAAGSYTATAKPDSNHAWSDGSTSAKNISWYIAKATLTATYAGETVAYGGTPKLAVGVTGFVNGESASTAAGYAAPTVAAPAALEAGKSYTLTPSGGSADNYGFSYVAGTLAVGAAPSDSGSDQGGDSGSGDSGATTPAETQTMYRLYNPNSGEHFYTASADEKDTLVGVGWNYEGIGWTAPKSSDTPVYRMYNSNPSPKTASGEHHYTTSASERDMLVAAGWQYEGIGWYSDDDKSVPLYRLYNPNEFNNNHHYTTSKDERDNLLSLGWKDEGIAWYGV